MLGSLTVGSSPCLMRADSARLTHSSICRAVSQGHDRTTGPMGGAGPADEVTLIVRRRCSARLRSARAFPELSRTRRPPAIAARRGLDGPARETLRAGPTLDLPSSSLAAYVSSLPEGRPVTDTGRVARLPPRTVNELDSEVSPREPLCGGALAHALAQTAAVCRGRLLRRPSAGLDADVGASGHPVGASPFMPVVLGPSVNDG